MPFASLFAAFRTAYAATYYCANCNYMFRSQQSLDAHVCNVYYP
ncbi:hypothetical protein [Nocardiopsis valliformis]|nr:hypothetical protein [Nocardiopsis valliformis]